MHFLEHVDLKSNVKRQYRRSVLFADTVLYFACYQALFLHGLFSTDTDSKLAVLAAMQRFHEKTCIRFRPRTIEKRLYLRWTGDVGLYISVLFSPVIKHKIGCAKPREYVCGRSHEQVQGLVFCLGYIVTSIRRGTQCKYASYLLRSNRNNKSITALSQILYAFPGFEPNVGHVWSSG